VSYLKRFLNSQLTLEGKVVAPKELQEQFILLEKQYHSVNLQDLVYIIDKDPIKMSIKFFSILDKGHVPCLLPSHTTSYQLEVIQSNCSGHLWKDDQFEYAQKASTHMTESCYAVMTSGSTGLAKMCFLSVKNAFLNAQMHCDSLKIGKKHLIIQYLPLYHSFGIVCYLFTLLEKQCALDFNINFLGIKTLNKRNFNKAVLHLSPSQTRFILKERADLPKEIDIISIGGGFIYSHELQQLQKKMHHQNLYVSYGMTEAGPRISSAQYHSDWHDGELGRAFSSVQCAVLTSEHKVSLSGEGRLIIKTPCLKINTTDNDFINDYYITEDQVSISSSGSITLKGRLDDVINFGGINIYPQDIEAAAMKIPQIKNVICLKKKNKTYGETPLLIFTGNTTKEKIIKFLKERLNVYQVPKEIYYIEKFPMTGLGKIDRQKVKEWLNEK